ncbi:hypothetical protein [Desulfonauticus submarinus]|uniref:Uncharacterized protein n=1 Tax=Desulfonauticus submarinus TaxID=206665 RepID=A0A1H0D9F7_9BACT|nr:hypothetical protein [Desulfonauticus submarinus]SDN66837.1 hypothetical protein SAMN04488516_10485 [Desulfonauticus submarinus]
MNQVDDASALAKIKNLEQEIEHFKQKLSECEKKIKYFREKEDHQKKIFFAQEIFNLQQEKLVIQTEIKFRQNKITKLRFELNS